MNPLRVSHLRGIRQPAQGCGLQPPKLKGMLSPEARGFCKWENVFSQGTALGCCLRPVHVVSSVPANIARLGRFSTVCGSKSGEAAATCRTKSPRRGDPSKLLGSGRPKWVPNWCVSMKIWWHQSRCSFVTKKHPPPPKKKKRTRSETHSSFMDSMITVPLELLSGCLQLELPKATRTNSADAELAVEAVHGHPSRPLVTHSWNGSPYLYCYWVGSLDFNFWILLMVPCNQQKLNFLLGIYSTRVMSL